MTFLDTPISALATSFKTSCKNRDRRWMPYYYCFLGQIWLVTSTNIQYMRTNYFFHLKTCTMKVCMRQFHDIWHLSIYGINLWFFETFREGPWCQSLQSFRAMGYNHTSMGDVSTFQPLTSMIHWKTPGLYIDVILFSWRDAGWDFPLNEQFRGRRCGALAFFWIDGSPHERWITIRNDRSLNRAITVIEK